MAEKQKLPIILAALIPVMMIGLVAASIYLPRLYHHPTINFLYYFINPNRCFDYVVKNGKLIQQKNEGGYYGKADNCSESLYFYDVLAAKSVSVDFGEMKGLSLSSEKQSADGFKIEIPESDTGYFPFYFNSYDYDERYLKGNGVALKINFPDNMRGHDFIFLGWVIKK